MGAEPCPDCGAPLGGRAGCDEAFQLLLLRPGQGPWSRAVHDAYCLQHPQHYAASVKSFMAHFRSLCVGVEHGSDPWMMRVAWEDLALPPGASKPAPWPHARATIAPIVAEHDPGRARAAGLAYARAVWDAWAPYHALARAWLEHALQKRR